MNEENISQPIETEATTDVTEKLSKQQLKAKQRQEEKERDQQRRYYNGYPSRMEVGKQIHMSLEQEREHIRQVYILSRSILQVLLDKGILTEKELEDASKPFHEMLYGKSEVPQETTNKEHCDEPECVCHKVVESKTEEVT